MSSISHEAHMNVAPVTIFTRQDEEASMLDVLTHCEVIHDALQNLDKKCDVIHKKIMKIQRLRKQALWYYRNTVRFSCRNSYVFSRRARVMKNRSKRYNTNLFSSSESCLDSSIPVCREENDNEGSAMDTPEYFDESQSALQEPELRELESPPLGENSQIPTSSGAISPTSLDQPMTSSVYNGLPIVECKHSEASACISADFVEGFDTVVLKQETLDDPSTWSVDEVVLFLKRADPQMACFLSGLIQQHEIDGKALLLLTTDMMMKYMGLKLGSALKLCHLIEKLKKERRFPN
ncbi:sex comb on midleg-like protein 1 isoform X2 [Perognathus longimembris pacificus]|uniref:sex comb on midleg-like protein 1 isoform X2 n=1 Tax=Perognathus longimembris pacificus TaxID=214514 RepID=UPI002019C42C|nr:sex comb on midleg-like protein 1 isoform X2 [Perognathus longimembris pacificus]